MVAGCGGTSPSDRVEPDTAVRLVALESGVARLSGAAVVPAGTNASLGTLDLSTARRFYVDDYLRKGVIGFRLTDAQGHLLSFSVGTYGEPLRSGSTYEFDASDERIGAASLAYEEDGRDYAFRTWSAQAGSVVIDSVTDDAVTLHVSGVRMVPGTGTRGGDFPTRKDSARGEFTLDLSSTLPQSEGRIAFNGGGGTSFDGRTIGPTGASFSAYSSRRAINLLVNDDATSESRGRSLRFDLSSRGDAVRVGDTFVLGEGQNVASAVDYDGEGSRIWTARSGSVAVKAIRGRLVTFDLAGVTLKPKERASGTIVTNGEITVLVP